MKELFTDHLETVGETYGQHFTHALSFSFAMFFASLACLVHAFLPFLFERTGSSMITRLHDRMVMNRHRLQEMKVDRRSRAAGR